VAGSPNVARIRAQVLDVCARIPAGALTTYAAIGDELAIPARHVAYVLATLPDAEADAVPWHRVVAEDGGLGRGPRASAKGARLAAEGVAVRGGRVADLDARFVRLALDATHRADPATPLGRSPAA
jgi:methylated-DNA-protein-cysteine methyltransferase related protein